MGEITTNNEGKVGDTTSRTMLSDSSSHGIGFGLPEFTEFTNCDFVRLIKGL